MIGYFQARDAFIPSLVFNIHDPNLVEVLYKFVDTELVHQWLFEGELITRLITLLHQDEPIEVRIILSKGFYINCFY